MREGPTLPRSRHLDDLNAELRPRKDRAPGRGFDESVWMAKRYEIVVRGNLAKFNQNDDLLRYLLSTAAPRYSSKRALAILCGALGSRSGTELASRPSEWKGLNLLGFALMDVRARLS